MKQQTQAGKALKFTPLEFETACCILIGYRCVFIKIYSVGVWNKALASGRNAECYIKIYSVGVWNSNTKRKCKGAGVY